MLGIDVKQPNGGPTRGRETDNLRSSYREMVPPGVLARVEKSHGSLRPRVDTAEIRPFIQVTAITGEAEIGRIVVTAVLLRNDVLDVEGSVDRTLWQSAVLATLAGPLSDQVANSGVYHEGRLARNDRAGRVTNKKWCNSLPCASSSYM